MRTFNTIAASVLVATATLAGATHAAGNLAAIPTQLETLVLYPDLTMSPAVAEYQLETGKYYRWRIESKGGEEFQIMAPELFRESWINQVVINDLEVKPYGLHSVEFDDEGVIDIWFIPIRPGEFEFWAEGFKERGIAGKFTVR